MPYWESLFAMILGYALGSVPFGLLLTRAAGLGDIRGIGSGNIGATNVLRTGNKGIAAATLLLDVGKAIAAVLIVRLALPGFEVLAGFGAFIGHIYPVWLRFQGGKGVATLIGMVTALQWQLGAIFVAAWLLSALLFRRSSLAGLIGTASVPVTAYFVGLGQWVPLFLAIAIIVFWRHRANIERLLAGTEPRIGDKR
jgi:glycerol-3-phosphate acyltransferase PlsY